MPIKDLNQNNSLLCLNIFMQQKKVLVIQRLLVLNTVLRECSVEFAKTFYSTLEAPDTQLESK